MIFPYDAGGGRFGLALADPADVAAQRGAEIVLGGPVAVSIASFEDIGAALFERLGSDEDGPSASRTFSLCAEQCEPRAAARRQLRLPAHQLASRLFCLSRSAILQPGYLTRVIVNCPSVSQRLIHILEIFPSARESSDNVVPGYVVSTLSDASGDPAQGNFGRGQS
jgi:hypothetical protein